MSIELALGIIGTVSGIGGLLIHYLEYKREKPEIEVELESCSHIYNKDFLEFKPVLTIRNRGDRPSTIFKIEMWAMIKTPLDFVKYGERPSAIGVDYRKTHRLEVNDTVNLKPTIKMPLSLVLKPDKKEIEFELIIHHTLGETARQGISEQVI